MFNFPLLQFLKETFDAMFAILVSPNCQQNPQLAPQVYDFPLII